MGKRIYKNTMWLLPILILPFQNCVQFKNSSVGNYSSGNVTAVPEGLNSPAPVTSPSLISPTSLVACPRIALSSTQQNLLNSFDVHLAYIGDGYSLHNNRQGLLGNNQPSVMDALLDAYIATGDEKYLQVFVKHGDRIISHRDDKAGFTDYRGRSAATWSDNAYSRGGQYVSFLIEDGALVASLAHFAAIVKKTSCLQSVKDTIGRTFDAVADSYIKAAGETFQFHFENWHTAIVNGVSVGYFSWPMDATFTDDIPGKPVAVNYQSAMGTALAYLAKATGNRSYLLYAQLLANFILYEMSYNYNAATDSYSWPYHPQMPWAPGAGVTQHTFKDDVSHATATVEFARAMFEENLGVFYVTEMRRVAHAFSRHIYGTSSVAIYVDGTGGDAGSRVYQFGRAAVLTPYDPGLWSLAYDVMVTRLNTDRKGQLGSLGSFTGLARLIRYYPR